MKSATWSLTRVLFVCFLFSYCTIHMVCVFAYSKILVAFLWIHFSLCCSKNRFCIRIITLSLLSQEISFYMGKNASVWTYMNSACIHNIQIERLDIGNQSFSTFKCNVHGDAYFVKFGCRKSANNNICSDVTFSVHAHMFRTCDPTSTICSEPRVCVCVCDNMKYWTEHEGNVLRIWNPPNYIYWLNMTRDTSKLVKALKNE